MIAAQRPWAADLLHFWFRELRAEQWFGRSEAVDAELRRCFARYFAALRNQSARTFLRDPLTVRAAVLLFDQVPRNLYRDDLRAFSSDPLARALTKGAVARGWDRVLEKPERQFLYMPLMHSEEISDPRLSLRLFTALGDSFITGFARDHYRMVARFGRFPHRNAVLGRTSTPAEQRAIDAGNVW